MNPDMIVQGVFIILIALAIAYLISAENKFKLEHYIATGICLLPLVQHSYKMLSSAVFLLLILLCFVVVVLALKEFTRRN